MPKTNYILPPEENVMPDGSVILWSIDPTEGLWGVEKLTDLNDIDFTPLKNPRPGYIYLLWYDPNADKKFSFYPVRNPRDKK